MPRNIDPFISLSFMALPVIPRLKITDMGMFDLFISYRSKVYAFRLRSFDKISEIE